MTEENLERKMLKHKEAFERLERKMVKDVNAFTEKNPDKTMYNLENTSKFIDTMCLHAAWIQDRINSVDTRKRRSLTSKIKKALGYTYYY